MTFEEEIAALPGEVSVKQFARLASCSVSTVRTMIRQNIIPANRINPLSARPTYRIPTWALRQRLGMEEPEPEYVSKNFGRL